jgi:hypothetical protein
MAFTDTSKANYAFKALLGKAHTSTAREFANETLLSGVTSSASRVWAQRVPQVAATAVANGIAVLLTNLTMEAVTGASITGTQVSYRAKLPGAVPAGLIGKINPLTGVAYASGDYIGNIIPESYGVVGASDYRPILRGNSVEITPLDAADWFLDPFAGIVTREAGGDSTNAWNTPITMDCYVYVGQMVDDAISTASQNITGFATTTLVASISATLNADINSRALDSQVVKLTGNQTINGQKTFTGITTFNSDVVINGTQFTVNTQTVSAADNMIEINAGEVGSGVTRGFAGIRVDRGSLDDFYFIFDEVRDRFVMGTMPTEISGNVSSLQVSATREDNPLPNGVAIWNQTLNRFDTISSANITGNRVNSINSFTGSVDISGSNGITISPNSNVITVSGLELQNSINSNLSLINSVSGSVVSLSGSIDSRFNNFTLNDLADVSTTSPSANQIIRFNGSSWVNSNIGAFLMGTVDCNIGQLTYDINDVQIASNSVPFVTLSVPTSGSSLVIQGVYGLQNGGFKVVLSSTPDEVGYKINWGIPLQSLTHYVVRNYTTIQSTSTTYTADASLSDNFDLSMTGNTTINAPVNMKDGQTIRIRLFNPSTHTLTFAGGQGFRYINGTAPSTPSTNNFIIVTITRFLNDYMVTSVGNFT